MCQSLEQQAADENTLVEHLEVIVKQSTELARLVARNPSASPELLQELASNNDKAIRQGVTTNPNTPTNVLILLAKEFPQEFLANPVFSLLLLENPNLAVEISYLTLLKLLEEDEVPKLFLSSAAGHSNSEVVYAVAKHPKTSQSVLEQIALKTRYDARLGQCIAQRQDVSERVLELLAEHGAFAVRLYLAKQAKIPSGILVKLTEISEPNENFQLEIHKAVAKNPNTPIWVIEKLLAQGGIKLKQIIAGRSHLPKHIIVDLARDFRVHSMRLLPRNRNIPASLLKELAEHPNLRVRQMVVAHPNTPTNLLLEALAVPELRQFIAENPNTPGTILQKLAADTSISIQTAVAENPNTPEIVLEQLAHNRLHDLLLVRHPNINIALRRKLLERLAADERLSVRIYVAKNPLTPINILTQWGKDSQEVRPWIAQNPSTPIQILEQLAKDLSALVRQGVAQNPNTSANVLEILAKDWEPEVRQAVARNPNTPGNVLETLVRDWHCISLIAQNPNTPATTLEQLQGFFGFEWFLVRHINTPLEMRQRLLKGLAKSYLELDRLYVARHPSTPFEILEELAKDRDQSVRSTALHRLKKHTN